MPDSIRTFVGVKVPCDRVIDKLLDALGGMGRAVRPVAADGMHVTLKFLGDVRAESVVEIEQALRTAVSSVSAFETELKGLGAFPHPGRPSVVWIGATSGDEFVRLAGAVEEALSPLGFPRESRPFHPHVTVARVKARPPKELGVLLEQNAETVYGARVVSGVTLYRSELSRRGPRYSVLGEFALSGG